jgi:hypothetical protein
MEVLIEALPALIAIGFILFVFYRLLDQEDAEIDVNDFINSDFGEEEDEERHKSKD